MPRSATLLALAAIAGCAGTEAALTSERVVGGRRASEAETHATVAVLWGGGLCTGTLVDHDLVVTAAHCVSDGWVASPGELEVVAASRSAYSGGERLAVRRVHVHPEYPGWSGSTDPAGLRRSHDIAVLELASPSRAASPIAVLDPDRADAILVPESMLLVSGYGDSETGAGTLYLADVPLVRTSETELLAGRRGTPDTCNGDSGGPAYARVEGALSLAGTTSRAREDTSIDCGAGGIYTLVPAYVAWIEDAIGRPIPLAGSSPAPIDAGPPDSGRPDAGPRDSGPRDAARPQPDAPGTDAGSIADPVPDPDPIDRPSPRSAALYGTCTTAPGSTAPSPATLLAIVTLALLVTRRRRLSLSPPALLHSSARGLARNPRAAVVRGVGPVRRRPLS